MKKFSLLSLLFLSFFANASGISGGGGGPKVDLRQALFQVARSELSELRKVDEVLTNDPSFRNLVLDHDLLTDSLNVTITESEESDHLSAEDTLSLILELNKINEVKLRDGRTLVIKHIKNKEEDSLNDLGNW